MSGPFSSGFSSGFGGFSTPRSWPALHLVLAAELNTDLRDNMRYLFRAGVVPDSLVIAWASTLDVPVGWGIGAACYGGGLVDRFVRGGGGALAPGATGGAAGATPSVHSSHGVTQAAPHATHVVTAPSHSTTHYTTNDAAGKFHASGGTHNPGVYGGHSHSGVGTTDDNTVTHSHAPISLLPPFVAVHYLQKAVSIGAWTDPRTWVTGEVPTAAELNIELRDNPNYLGSRLLPPRTLLHWSGALGTAPIGWSAADGTLGTIDTRDRLLVGADGVYAFGDTGGVANQTLSNHGPHTVTQPAFHSDHTVSQASGHSGIGDGWNHDDPISNVGDTGHSGFAVNSHGNHTGFGVGGHAAHVAFSILPPFRALPAIELLAGTTFTPPRTWVTGDIVTQAELNSLIRDNELCIYYGQFPIGGITPFALGTVPEIPAGWHLCDGGGGALDLRDLFPLGAGLSYAPGTTGGSANVTPAAHADHTMNEASGHTSHLVTQPVDHYDHVDLNLGSNSGTGDIASGLTHNWSLDGHSAHTGSALSTHTAHDTLVSLPPYVALFYIQRMY